MFVLKISLWVDLQASYVILSSFLFHFQLPLSITDLWALFCGRCRVFPFHYAVYLYYRAKGWVAKHGLRVGAHFTLYPQGPPFFHAEFSVRVQVLRSDTLTPVQMAGDAPLASMKDLMTLHRVTNKVDKVSELGMPVT